MFQINDLGFYKRFSQKLRKAPIRFVMSVCLSVCLPAWNNSVLTETIFIKFVSSVFFENLPRIMNTLLEDLCKFVTISG